MSTGPATGTPIIIGNAIEGQTLTVDVSSVSDPDGIQFMGALWQRSTDGGVTFTDAIPFFSPDPTYVVVGADVGALLRVQIGVQDLLGNLSAVFSDPTAPVTSDNHEPTGVPIITGTFLVGETLTADASAIADDDGLGTFSYSWVRLKEGDSTVVSNTDTYTLTADDAHARFKVIVTYQDGASFTEDVESAFSQSVASAPGDVPPRIEFRFGDNKVDENDQGGSVGVLTFDGILNPSLTYTIVSDPAGRFEMNGFELRLTASTSFDFEASATQQVQIRVTDGASLDYTETVTIDVIDKNAIASFLTHAPISDPTVAADVAGLVFPGGNGDPLSSPQWVGENVIEVTFPDTAIQFNLTGLDDFSRPFSEVEKGIARGIFASVSALTLFGFTEVDFPGGGNASQNVLDLGIGHLSAGISGVALIPPGTALLVGDVETHGDETLLGGGFHYVLMHELGHALGLDHGHNNGGTSGPSGDSLPHLPLAHDRSAYSVMTYNNTTDGNPQSYMIADIATLQYLYGADFTLNSGDTTYTWSTTGETFINGVSKGATFDTHILMSIWDGGGTDTYDASNYDDGVEIDLRPGEFSTISVDQLGKPTAIGNVGNAYLYDGDTRSLIENAIGGDGDDTLTGNEAANVLTGGAGTNAIDGGTGDDTAAFLNNRSAYTLQRVGGTIVVTGVASIDTLASIEHLRFTDITLSASNLFDPRITSDGGGGTATRAIAENSTTVTTVQATDDDPGTTLTYTIAGGADQSKFQIDASTGALSFINAPDFELPDDADHNNSYLVTVRASDGTLTDDQAITVNVTAVNEAPQITSSGGGATATVSVSENSTVVTTAIATDQDVGSTISYSLVGGADQSRFQINPSTGALSFINAPDFEAPDDADHNNSYVATVRASDGTLTDDQAITVNVTAVNEAPQIASTGGGATATVSASENSTVVTTVVAMDQDAGSTISYSLVGGVDQGEFQINASTGALSFINAPDFELTTDADHNNSYLVTVRASDGSLNDDQAITVTVTDVSEAPRIVHWAASVDVGAHPVGWSPAGISDFNADGTSDLGWYNAAIGNIDIWKLSNGGWAGSADVGSHPPGYQPVGFGDFNGDSTDDVLWFNATTRDVDLWKISNAQWAGSVSIGTHPAGYAPSGTGDFNGDETSDVLWYNATTHHTDIWLISNGQWAGSVDVGLHPAGYQPALTGDFNGDGTSDIAWFNASNGNLDIWKISNGQWAGSVDLGSHPAGWQPLGAADFNLDGTSDIVPDDDQQAAVQDADLFA